MKQKRQQRDALLTFVERGYLEGRSLRFLAAQTDRSQTAIRRALRERGVALRRRGAPLVEEIPDHLNP